jgi:hypothetical protein
MLALSKHRRAIVAGTIAAAGTLAATYLRDRRPT